MLSNNSLQTFLKFCVLKMGNTFCLAKSKEFKAQEPIKCILIGLPNTGKQTVLNAYKNYCEISNKSESKLEYKRDIKFFCFWCLNFIHIVIYSFFSCTRCCYYFSLKMGTYDLF